MLISYTRRRENEIQTVKRNKWRLLFLKCYASILEKKELITAWSSSFIQAGRFHFGNWGHELKSLLILVCELSKAPTLPGLGVEFPLEQPKTLPHTKTTYDQCLIHFSCWNHLSFSKANYLAAAIETSERSQAFTPDSFTFFLRHQNCRAGLPDSSENNRFDLAKVVLHSCPQRRGHGHVYLSKTAPES